MKKTLSILFILITQISYTAAQSAMDSLTITRLQWNVTNIEPGIVHRHVQEPWLYDCPQNINIIEVDLKKRKDLGIAIAATQQMQKTSITASENNALAAINGSYFDMKKGNSVCFFRQGEMVVDTTTANEFKMRVTGAIVVDKKGRINLIPWDKKTELKNIKKNKKANILASGPLMLRKGRYVALERSKFNTDKHPRSAIARTKDNKVLFVTVDGRHKGNAEGINIFELSQLLKLLGATEAVNFDGGGSTTLWLKDAPEEGVLNMPTDNKKFDHQGQRPVPNIILVKEKEKK